MAPLHSHAIGNRAPSIHPSPPQERMGASWYAMDCAGVFCQGGPAAVIVRSNSYATHRWVTHRDVLHLVVNADIVQYVTRGCSICTIRVALRIAPPSF